MEGNKEIILIFSDGGARGNGKAENIGGWGAVLSYKGKTKEIYGAQTNTTNNKMELTAAIMALKELKTTHIPVEIRSDSAYVINGITSWVKGWKKNGWRTSTKKPVGNKELWQELDELVHRQTLVIWTKVKGHSGNKGNERADELVNIAMDVAEME